MGTKTTPRKWGLLLAALAVPVLGILAALELDMLPRSLGGLLFVLLLLGPLFLLASAVGEMLVEALLAGVARLTLPILSLGRVRVASGGEPLASPWHGVARSARGRWTVSTGVAPYLGFLILAALIIAALAWAM